MKRILSLFFILAFFAIAQSAHAQTDKPRKKKGAKREQSGDSGGSITIDESGQSRPTKSTAAPAPPPPPGSGTQTDTTAAPKDPPQSGGSAQKAQESPAPAPNPIAIDESGASSPKSKPEASKPIGDTAIMGPAQQLERPKR